MLLRQFRLLNQHDDGSVMGVGEQCNPSEFLRNRILFIETWAMSPDNIHLQDMQDGSVKWNVRGHRCMRMCLSEGAESEIELVKELKQKGGRWRCILLAEFSLGLNLLILKKEVNEDLWLRVGMIVLHCLPRYIKRSVKY
ncbi:hypothetical protein F4804DRAFT_307067 [Jackrogersella minutella]|nr:hypothetical protein F4804DRAFT_307067 [Jackrogersella minutella]